VWFVGDDGVITFDGHEFADVPSHRSRPNYFAIWFSGSGDGWLSSSNEQLLRFDGVHAPTVAGRGPYGRLWGLASDEVYAFGSVWGGGDVRRWDGATWSDVSGLYGIAAIAGRGQRDKWAVGTRGMVLRYE
jgi:hypothetical protein